MGSEHDDEEMDELFSFGSPDVVGVSETNAGAETTADGLMKVGSNSSSINGDVSFDNSASVGSNTRGEGEIRVRKSTSDSFMELLNEGSGGTGGGELVSSGAGVMDHGITVMDDEDEILGAMTVDSLSPSKAAGVTSAVHDKETQEMLDWLEEDAGSGNLDDQDTVVFVSDDEPNPPSPSRNKTLASSPTFSSPAAKEGKQTPASSPVKETEALDIKKAPPPPPPSPKPTVVPLPPVFETLTDALNSTQATLSQVRLLAQKTPLDQLATMRPDLYCRLICGNKTAEQTRSSSLADSFSTWQIPRSMNAFWIPKAATFCVESFALRQFCPGVTDDCLIKLLAYNNVAKAGADTTTMDFLVPCVASVILAAGVSLAAASVVLGQVQAHFMPLTALAKDEQWDAAMSLHHALYLLAAYHLPLLVVHLDRYLPGWFGPQKPHSQSSNEETSNALEGSPTQRARQWEKQGQIPQSWLLSFLSGEVYGKNLPMKQILRLWDAQLTHVHCQSLRFFLTLAVLERVADSLILVTGQELVDQLQQAFVFDNSEDCRDWFEKEWMEAAQTLFSATPVTVLEKLRTAEDEAVQSALKARQERAEVELQARLKAEAAAHQRAQELKAEQARQRLTRARLVAFYRKHAPEKEENIDKILANFADRLEVLDAKLFQKYGESFQPALKPKKTSAPPPPQQQQQQPDFKIQNQTLSAANNFFSGLGRMVHNNYPTSNNEFDDDSTAALRKPDQVSVLVSTAEVMPIICGATSATKSADEFSASQPHPPLRYFLVDSRSEEAAAEQGRFPNAVTLSPESMLDPDMVSKHEERFESLRGTVHIVIMGEGFSAISTLYKQQKLTPALEAALVQDESRTNICALFFIKKGFPFVSVLDGGFAAAHAWLVRDGPKYNLQARKVLVDYDPLYSVFGQMESLHNASATEKAQRQLQNLVEKSLVAVTLQAQQFEKMTEGNKQKSNSDAGGGGGLRLGSIFRGAAQVGNSANASRAKSPGPDDGQEVRADQQGRDEQQSALPNNQFRIRNPFARSKSDGTDDDPSVDSSSDPTGITSAQDGGGKKGSGTTLSTPQNEQTSTNKVKSGGEVPKPLIASSKPSGASGSGATGGGGVGLAASNILRNPFRGFGSTGNKAAVLPFTGNTGNKPTHGRNLSSGGFASLNSLRKSALGRMKSDPNMPDGSEKQGEGEESISFN